MRAKLLSLTLAALLSAGAAHAAEPRRDDCAAPSPSPLLSEGCKVLDDFLTAFNARDPQAWAKTLKFPHIRLAGGQVQVWNTPQDYAASNDVAQFANTGWRYTKWDWRQLVQQGDDKLHFILQFTRYGDGDKKIASYESLYILTKSEGNWGVQFRSSYAGVAGAKTAY